MRLNGTLLTTRFSVHSPLTPSVNPALPLGASQWGLWDWDVVEIFVSCAESADRTPYYEFQLSPIGQHFELEIFEPRKRFNREFKSGFTHSVRIGEQGAWEAEMVIPLDRLGWQGDVSTLTGNAFAVLGPSEARAYWSLFLEPQQKPDFHLPREFRPLVANDGGTP